MMGRRRNRWWRRHVRNVSFPGAILPGETMGAAVAVIVRKQREIVEVFEGARATTAELARFPDELGIDESHIFHGLVRRAVLRPAGDGRYYVDEPSWVAMRDMRRRRLGVVLIIIVALVVGLALAAGTRI